jgi:hypothetical protein
VELQGLQIGSITLHDSFKVLVSEEFENTNVVALGVEVMGSLNIRQDGETLVLEKRN